VPHTMIDRGLYDGSVFSQIKFNYLKQLSQKLFNGDLDIRIDSDSLEVEYQFKC